MTNPRTKNLAIVGGAVVVVGFVAVNTLMTAPPPAPTVAAEAGTPEGAGPALPSPGPEPVPSPGSEVVSPTDAGTERRSYAIGLHELAGFPPDAAPGTRLELWVTWEPPATRGPRLQKLIGDVVLERTIPGSVPEAPVTILLSVPADRVGDLIYADGYGKLSVAAPG